MTRRRSVCRWAVSVLGVLLLPAGALAQQVNARRASSGEAALRVGRLALKTELKSSKRTASTRQGTLESSSEWAHDSGRSAKVRERLTRERGHWRWDIRVETTGSPWSTPIEMIATYPAAATTRFWTAWSSPANARGWQDPLEPQPLADREWFYGLQPFSYRTVCGSSSPKRPNLAAFPSATLFEPEANRGVTLWLTPEAQLLDVLLRTTKDGAIVLTHQAQRFEEGRPFELTVYIVEHDAQWFRGLEWARQYFPAYFKGPLPMAHELGGTAAYSPYDASKDSEFFRSLGFRTNWLASFDFPYMGLFLPPLADDVQWPRFTATLKPDAPQLKLPRETSIDAMAAYSKRMREAGFHVLNYFNVTEYGTAIDLSKQVHSDPPWRDANAHLQSQFPDAVIKIPEGATNCKAVGVPHYTWGRAVAVDPADPAYRAHLLEQARRHVMKLPQSSGICIDRMDWLRLFNMDRDDGRSWMEGRPARSLLNSWRDLMKDLLPIFHEKGKVVFVNNHVKRIDLLKDIDGIYDEFSQDGASLNLTAFLATDRPALGWVESSKDFQPDPDAFLQRYLYMGVFPMAPFPDNDHSLRPEPWLNQLYADYGAFFDALRGRQWLLEPIGVRGSRAKVNAFATPHGKLYAVMLGGSDTSAKLVLPQLPRQLQAEILHPGKRQWTPLRVEGSTITAPLVRGCALVRLK